MFVIALIVIAAVLLAAGILLTDIVLVYISLGPALLGSLLIAASILDRRSGRRHDKPDPLEDDETCEPQVEDAAKDSPGEFEASVAAESPSPNGHARSAPADVASHASPAEPAGTDPDAGGHSLQDSSLTVFVIPGRRRFHVDGCKILGAYDREAITVEEARDEGFTACSVCASNLSIIEEAP